MAEKSGNQSADVNLTENNLAYLRATLCSLDSVKPNFAMVSEDWGLGKGGHGLRGFKAALSKLDLDFKNGKIYPNDGSPTVAPARTTKKAIDTGLKKHGQFQDLKRNKVHFEVESEGSKAKKPKKDADEGPTRVKVEHGDDEDL